MRTQQLARMGGAGVLLFLGLTMTRTNGDEAEPDPPREPRRIAEKAVDVPKLMQRKLDSSQRILRGLVNGDMQDVRGGADVLSAVARSRSWAAREDDAVFAHFNVEFQRLAGKLGRMAEQRNLEGAAYVYNQLTSTCISCHDHVRDVKRVPTVVPLSTQQDSE